MVQSVLNHLLAERSILVNFSYSKLHLLSLLPLYPMDQDLHMALRERIIPKAMFQKQSYLHSYHKPINTLNIYMFTLF